jgi:1,2-phenylacetyl-CoA epoxidase PaaB subunit
MWADYGLPLNPEQSAKDGYPNLKKNGKGVLSASNIDYYIDTLKASKSPRSLYWTKKVSSVVQTTEVIARLARGKKLYDLGAKGRRIAVARPYFVTTRRFESSSGLYLNDSDSGHTFNPSDKHLFSDWTKESNSAEGYWILKRKANPKQFVIVDPLKFTDY